MLKQLIPSGLKKQIKLLLHKGDKYTCPFCHFSAKDLELIGLDFPVLKEKQVVGAGKRYGGCYGCGSSDRERLIYIFLKEELNLLDKGKSMAILHVAPEKNLTNKLLTLGLDNYICGDWFTEGYNYPKHVRRMNVLDIPFEANTFDLVICNHVLEHIPNDRDAMKELFRVLKPGGKAILQVPISKNISQTVEDFTITDPKERERVFGQFDHVRIYGQDYTDRLTDCGFKVKRVNISNKYSQYGLNPDEDIFLAEK